MQKASSLFAIVLFSLCSGLFGHAQAAPANAKPGGINCSVRKSPLSPGDIAFSHSDLPKAIDLYREESKAKTQDGDRAHTALVRSLLLKDKVQDADNEVHAWTSTASTNLWAKVALGEVQWRQGKIAESIATTQAVIQADFCNSQAHADYAKVLFLTGMPASGQKQLDIAHRLDPIDDTISAQWTMSLPRSAQLAAVDKYIEQSSSLLTEKERKSWELRKARLSQPAAPSCRLSSPIASVQLPFRAIQSGPQSPISWGLDVYFNGKVRHLEIDTGASGMMLTKGAADALHLETDSHNKTFGIGDEGAVDSHSAKVQTIKIGSLQFDDCEVRVLDKTPELLQGKDGLIGGDVFRAFLLTLDFPGRMFKLDPLPTVPVAQGGQNAPSLDTGADTNDGPRDRYIDPSMASWTKVIRVGHDVLVPVRINGGPVRFFIVDTGGHVDLISKEAAKAVTKVEGGTANGVEGISGKVNNMYIAGPLKLEFSGLTYPTPAMNAIDTIDLARGAGLEIGGLLGTNILHQLTLRIDYRDDLVNFTYDPKRLSSCVQGVVKVDCY